MASCSRLLGTLGRSCSHQGFPSTGKVIIQRTLKTDSNASNSNRSSFLPHKPVTSNNGQLDIRICQQRFMSSKNFFQTVIDNIRQDMKKSKEMKESIAKFKEETQKLEESDALRQARKKFESIEEETLKSSTAIKKTLDDIKEKVSETVEEAQKTEFVKKGIETATKAAESIQKSGQAIGQSDAFKQISQGVRSAKEEFDEITLSRARHYKAPEVLQKRSELSMKPKDNKDVQADDYSTGMVLHKDSRFYQSWQNFKDNNQYVNKLFDLKVKYDESDNVMIRATRFFTDKVGQVFGGVFTKTEMSEVLTEICKIDPHFNKEQFIRLCEREIIPNILEALVRGDLVVLKDWCYEAPYNTLAHPIEQAKKVGYYFDSKVLDVSHADVIAGKIMEQGPVLVINFNAQQIMIVRDAKGKVVEGDPDKILRILYVWALCRDQEELNPRAAWKLMDISASSSEQWL